MESDELTRLRDFVYLDVERVKSLLVQMDRGLLSDRVDSSGSSTTVEGRGGFSIPALLEVGGTGGYVSTDQSSETRTLHDFVYNWTEERLLQSKRVKRFPQDFDRDHLLNERIRSSISPVEYLLVRGQVAFRDFAYMTDLMENFNDLARMIHELAQHETIKNSSGREKTALQSQLQEKINSTRIDEKMKKNLTTMFKTFLVNRLTVRVIPFPEHADIRVIGPIQRQLLRESMDDIRFKFGTSPTADWTVFGQVASVPKRGEVIPSLDLSFAGEFDGALETLFKAMGGIEAFFRVGYPEIAITPIAIYRD